MNIIDRSMPKSLSGPNYANLICTKFVVRFPMYF